MLVISRKQGESVLIDENTEIVVLEVKHGKVRLGIQCPESVRILRRELIDREEQHRPHIPSIAEHAGAGMWDREPI